MSHEDLSREAEVEGTSNRSFGSVFTAFFAIVGLLPLLSSGEPRIWSLVVAAIILGITLGAPHWLTIPNRLWMRFGLLLGRIVSPIVTAVLFYLVFTPFGIVMRLFRKDPLRLTLDPNAPTYWIDRDPPGPEPKAMKNQF